MIRNYNGCNFSKLEQYDALILLLSNSKKTLMNPVFSIENVLNNEGLLLYLLNQKKFIEISRQKNSFGNMMYKLTRKGNRFIEKFFFSQNDYLFLTIINIVIFILPIFTIMGVNILKAKISNELNIPIEINLNLFLLISWLILIIYIMIKNSRKKSKKYNDFKKKYNLK